jgi:hypothetical protein
LILQGRGPCILEMENSWACILDGTEKGLGILGAKENGACALEMAKIPRLLLDLGMPSVTFTWQLGMRKWGGGGLLPCSP